MKIRFDFQSHFSKIASEKSAQTENMLGYFSNGIEKRIWL